MLILKYTIALSVVLGAFLILSACSEGKDTLGKEVPVGTETVLLADLLSNPSKWNGKLVLLKGNVSSQCASLCDFTLKDGASVVTVFPDNYSLPKLKIGRAAEVYAQITSGEERVVVSAIGIRFK